MGMEFTDISLEVPDPSLFEPPSGGKTFNNKWAAMQYMAEFEQSMMQQEQP